MSRQGTIHRYALIVEKTRRGYPSLKDVHEFLVKHDFEISQRTLQRDVEQIRYEFGLEIKYHPVYKGYYFDEDKNPNVDTFLRFLEMMTTAHLLAKTLEESKQALEYISFESEGNLKGIETLKDLLIAVQKHRKITFIHYNYSTEKRTNYTLLPYLLKEYQNRWYVVGQVENTEEIRTFGIDRLEALKIHNQVFKRDKNINIKELFQNAIGLTYTAGKPEEILLKISPLQWRYLQSLPLHSSQQLVLETEEEVKISLYVVPNYELLQKLLMLGNHVQVLKPKSLAKQMRNTLEKTLEGYL